MKIFREDNLDKIPELKIGNYKKEQRFRFWCYWWDFIFKFSIN